MFYKHVSFPGNRKHLCFQIHFFIQPIAISHVTKHLENPMVLSWDNDGEKAYNILVLNSPGFTDPWTLQIILWELLSYIILGFKEFRILVGLPQQCYAYRAIE